MVVEESSEQIPFPLTEFFDRLVTHHVGDLNVLAVVEKRSQDVADIAIVQDRKLPVATPPRTKSRSSDQPLGRSDLPSRLPDPQDVGLPGKA